MFEAMIKAAVLLMTGFGLTVGSLPSPAFAQANLRSTFPGRRVGGGTRGECSSRILAHLVPNSSVYSPGGSGDLGLVQGPIANPVSLTMTFTPNSGGGVESNRAPLSSPQLVAIESAHEFYMLSSRPPPPAELLLVLHVVVMLNGVSGDWNEVVHEVVLIQ